MWQGIDKDYETTSRKHCADVFCKQFVSVGNKVSEPIPENDELRTAHIKSTKFKFQFCELTPCRQNLEALMLMLMFRSPGPDSGELTLGRLIYLS